MNTSTSKTLFTRAQKVLPGGVNSPVRAFKAVGGTPLFFEKAKGAYLHDVDQNRYIDYVGSWGPMIAGHAHPEVVKVLKKAAELGTSFGAPNPHETELAETIRRFYPSMEKVRLVNSGTEAVLAAIRLARAFTQRDKLIKFEGCYHGHADSMLVKAGSGALTLGLPGSAGVLKDLAQHTLTAPYNSVKRVEELFAAYPKQIAALILEPVVGNSGLILPQKDFLTALRKITEKHGALLIFDEVMTGFRVHLKGAQGLFKIKPDLTTLGKVIGGGLPVGAFGGRREIMDQLAPLGAVYQAGTLSGNPLAMAAGLKTIELASIPGTFDQIKKTTQLLAKGLLSAAKEHNIAIQVPHLGSMLSVFFSETEITDLSSATASNTERFNQFFHGMLERGVYLPPSAFESWFVSAAHGPREIEKTLKIAKEVFEKMNGESFAKSKRLKE